MLESFFNKVAIRSVTFLKRDFNTDVFLWILRNFYEKLFWNICEQLLQLFLYFPEHLRGCFTLYYLSVLFVSIYYISRFLVFHVLWMRSFQMKIKAIKFMKWKMSTKWNAQVRNCRNYYRNHFFFAWDSYSLFFTFLYSLSMFNLI